MLQCVFSESRAMTTHASKHSVGRRAQRFFPIGTTSKMSVSCKILSVMTNTAERHISLCLSDILTLYREHGFYCLNSAATNEPEPIVKDVSHVMFYSTVTIFLRITYVFPILLAKTVDLMRLLVCKL